MTDETKTIGGLHLAVVALEDQLSATRTNMTKAIVLLKRAGDVLATYEMECTSTVQDDDLLPDIGAFLARVAP